MNIATLETILVKRDIRPTVARLLVLKALIGSQAVVSLSDLEIELDTVDRSTISRALILFQQRQLVYTMDDGSGALKYALCDEGHECLPEQQYVRFYCTVCEHTFCLHHTPVPLISIPKNFTVESVQYIMHGVCSKCAKKSAQRHQ
ncbi:MAG: transcriptional repressor [Prevotellaceae bacterium]|jgi:Fur family ferric uptake transcriptional regulator|nr:transcriptional repressor [Prevotellaceae bacterium]